MSNQATDSGGPGGLGREEMQSAHFAQLVMQQSNMALMLLGKVPHPESGQSVRDLDAARMFIDQLEMLEVKTRGNLNPQERELFLDRLVKPLATRLNVDPPAVPRAVNP